MRLPIQNDNLQGLDLKNMLTNPDKFDYADPDHMVINPKSDYYHVPSLKKVRSKLGAKSISSLHCNIRNISKNIGLLEDMFYSLREQPDYDVIGVTETRLNANTVLYIELPHYSIYHTDFPTPAGQVALYNSKASTSFPRSDITLDMLFVESIWVEKAPCNNKKPILVGCIYKHPRANIHEFKE